MNVRRIVIIDNTAGSVTVCFYLISNKQSLGFQNIKLVLANSDDKYNFEACNGIITSNGVTLRHCRHNSSRCFSWVFSPGNKHNTHKRKNTQTHTYIHTHTRGLPLSSLRTILIICSANQSDRSREEETLKAFFSKWLLCNSHYIMWHILLNIWSSLQQQSWYH